MPDAVLSGANQANKSPRGHKNEYHLDLRPTPIQAGMLQVRFGQATFNAEGTEIPGRFFSRQIHWSGGSASGVTIGRGYDLGGRKQNEIMRDLQAAGVSEVDSRFFARAAGLRGVHAKLFVQRNIEAAPVISLGSQKKLFERILVPYYKNDVMRIFSSPCVVRQYGEALWEGLSDIARKLVFDLRYRGDFTPQTRTRIQKFLVNNDINALKEVMSDRRYWLSRGVPADRVERRIKMFTQPH